MIDWIKEDEVSCSIENLQDTANNLCQKYKTQVVLINKIVIDTDCIIEIWFNFNSQMYLLNVVQHIK